MKEQLQKILKQSLNLLENEGVLESAPENIRIDHTKDKTQGDFASNIAMVLAKRSGLIPKVLAQKIIDNLG